MSLCNCDFAFMQRYAVSFNTQLLFAISNHEEKKDKNETNEPQHILILHTAPTISNEHVRESAC